MSLQCMPVDRPRRRMQPRAPRKGLQRLSCSVRSSGQVVVQIDSIWSMWHVMPELIEEFAESIGILGRTTIGD